MGNWTTVNITGTCNKKDLPALKKAVNSYNDSKLLHKYGLGDWELFNCLSNTGGLCGLGDWTGETIYAIGNLAERDFTTNDIAEQLEKLVEIAPSLNLKIHVGGDYESLDCISTIECKDGQVNILEPEISTILEIPQEQIQNKFISIMTGMC